MEQEILDILQEYKGNKSIYLIVFNILTENNTKSNYSYNNNGIFFNLSLIDKKKIHQAREELKKISDVSSRIEIEEEKRIETIKNMNDSLSSCYISELKDVVSDNKGIYSSDITQEIRIKNETEDNNHQKRMKKSIDEFLRPRKLKNSRLRINRILNKTSGRHKRSDEKISKQSDDLYREIDDENENELDDNKIEETFSEEEPVPEDDEDLFGDEELSGDEEISSIS